jgi:pimeloyl-ACP methyl ester esterase
MKIKQKPDCVLLHGWGSSNTIWNGFAENLSGFATIATPCLYKIAGESIDNKFKSIATTLEETIENDCVVIAWSLGGLIATVLAGITDRVKVIVFIASAPCFVNKADWHNVLDSTSVNNLQKRLLKDPKATLEYFAGLIAHGDLNQKTFIRLIRENMAKENNSAILFDWLNELLEQDLRKQFAALTIPTQHILAEHDALVNMRIEKQIKQLQANTSCSIINNCGHAPFISYPEETSKLINEFVNERFK